MDPAGTGDIPGPCSRSHQQSDTLIGNVRLPQPRIADGNIVETLNSRYLLSQRNTADDEIFAKLDAWLAEQPSPPTLLDVLAVRDIDLLNAFILRGFRAAAAEAVWRAKKDS